jgi:23S rRNA U2552 (ribose-2'-O)-methylase RlmE/FtsJ
MMMVMNMDAVFIRAIDNFDFTSYIPKIVIFLEKETVLDNTFACFLGFFTKIGFDIVIFDPSGLYNPHVILNEDHLNIIRLDEMNYESTYESLSQIKEKKEGFFKRFFL